MQTITARSVSVSPKPRKPVNAYSVLHVSYMCAHDRCYESVGFKELISVGFARANARYRDRIS